MKYFGTDGIRGKAYSYITLDLAYKIGKSLSIVLNKDEVIISGDTRESTKDIIDSIAKGASSVGMKVIVSETCPTPHICNYSLEYNILGVMVTASHNPYEDNGIKIFDSGYKLSKEQELSIEDYLDYDCNSSVIEGTIEYNDAAYHEYHNLLRDIYFGMTDYKIALDFANGAAARVGEELFSHISHNLFITGNKPNGKNINDKVGSLHIDNLIKVVKDNNCDVGFSFDGDADRLIVVDEFGRVFDGDEVIYILAKYMNKTNILSSHKIALTKMSNLGIINKLKEEGIETIQTDVGDKYVLRALKEYNLSLGGENSGHIILKDILPTGDGILAAIYLLKLVTENNTTLRESLKDVVMYPDKLVNIKTNKKHLVNDQKVLDKVSSIKESLGEEGKILVRASGTEDLIRISCSAKDMSIVDKHIKDIKDLIESL